MKKCFLLMLLALTAPAPAGTTPSLTPTPTISAALKAGVSVRLTSELVLYKDRSGRQVSIPAGTIGTIKAVIRAPFYMLDVDLGGRVIMCRAGQVEVLP